MKIEEALIEEHEDFRVLIYPASRTLLPIEVKEITEKLFDFLPTWNAHGAPLKSSFKIAHGQFIIISIDEEETAASGCSMDSLNAVMRQIDEQYQLGLFDRMKAAYLSSESSQVVCVPLADFRNRVKNGLLDSKDRVFDFSVMRYTEFLSRFLLPLNESWAGKLVPPLPQE